MNKLAAQAYGLLFTLCAAVLMMAFGGGPFNDEEIQEVIDSKPATPQKIPNKLAETIKSNAQKIKDLCTNLAGTENIVNASEKLRSYLKKAKDSCTNNEPACQAVDDVAKICDKKPQEKVEEKSIPKDAA